MALTTTSIFLKITQNLLMDLAAHCTLNGECIEICVKNCDYNKK